MKCAIYFGFGLLCATAFSCSGERGSDYFSQIKEHRLKTNKEFVRGGSPLLPEDRKNFVSLNYFPPDTAFCIAAEVVDISDTSGVFEMATSTGEVRKYIVHSHLYFTINDTACRLTAFQSVDDENDELFIPFSDATSGDQTYGGGRYLNIEIEEVDDSVIIDFNKAYNPYCHYNPDFSCPIPPLENDLEIAVRAGEKLFK